MCMVLQSLWTVQPAFPWPSSCLGPFLLTEQRYKHTTPASPGEPGKFPYTVCEEPQMYLNSTRIRSQSEILAEIGQEPSRHLKLNITQLCRCLGFCGDLLSHLHSLQLCIPYTINWPPTINYTARPWPYLSPDRFGYKTVFQGITSLWQELQEISAIRPPDLKNIYL